jgi:hypothetical protein
MQHRSHSQFHTRCKNPTAVLGKHAMNYQLLQSSMNIIYNTQLTSSTMAIDASGKHALTLQLFKNGNKWVG